MKYDPALDGLRAFSVAVVLILHAYKGFMPGGWIGVEVFFVLSGFLITNILLKEDDRSGRIVLSRFYLRRFLRLGPALLALIAACIVIAPFQGRPLNLGELIAAATYTMNWYRAFGLGGDDMLGHTWSLAIEEQFYLLWPAFLILVPRGARLPATLVLIVAVTCWRGYLAMAGYHPYRMEGFDAHCDTLLLGCAVALVWREQTPKLPAWCGYVALIVLGVILFTVKEGPMMAFAISVTGLMSCVLMICVRQDGLIRRVLMWRPFVFTGRISYGLYLWHYPITVVAIRHIPEALMWLPIVISYGVAVASYYVIETPALRLKDRLDATRPRSPDVSQARGGS